MSPKDMLNGHAIFLFNDMATKRMVHTHTQTNTFSLGGALITHCYYRDEL